MEKHDSKPVVHFDAGNALRAFAAHKGYTQEKVDASLKRGELQPMFVLANVRSEFFISNMKGDEHLLVSGFPRREDQLMLFRSAMEFYKREPVHIIDVVVSDAETRRRLLLRARHDDTNEGIDRRLAWYKTEVVPAIEYLKKQPRYRFHRINGEQAPEQVHRDILKALVL